ncbi:streptomycin 6-kinase [Kitasatospora sp. SolWspMP-SS2h]|uniref:aminoglycoside phosphotransferase family protein n=1 Tax=Kitasatospora sp. SolWspMP-SS2h TaxID=1305729 RepID=UPI000DBABB4E|nr:aminoglycoside phosphotransferase family protein [Kitasatospora sp. SolWspMP-SS2h]RAJ47086.1 streptomycin 6-kinase [Kitasatospora sp. SolWspMP-SS2h]
MEELARVGPEVRERFVGRFGGGVLGWCDALPGLVVELAGRWGLEPVAAGGGGTSRVFRCVRRGDGARVWLKLTPDPSIAGEEAEALRAWAGRASVVALLAADTAAGALLLADVRPGTPVRQLGWTLPEVASLLRDLRSAARPAGGSGLRPLAHRIGFLFDLAERRASAAGTGAGADLAGPRAAALALAAGGPPGLVHGDLHPSNVLSGPGGRLVAIDPRPTWGDPDFDAVDWALEGVTDLAALRRRTDRLAALVPGLSPDRLLAWCRALSALTAVPRTHAGRGEDPQTRFLARLAGLRPD